MKNGKNSAAALARKTALEAELNRILPIIINQYRPEKIIFFCLIVWWTACENPFSTRDPEPPERTGSRWIPPFAAEIVLENLKNAVSDQNAENYLRCFSDSTRTGLRFQFEADAATRNANPGLFDSWSLNEERDYFAQLRAALPSDSSRSLRLDSLQTVVLSDSAVFLESYDLTVRHRRQSAGVPGRVRGELRFWLVKDQFGEWSIQRWADFSSGQAPTWSALKAAFVR